MAFAWSLVFMLDFTAAWFNYYSRFLAGDRTRKVQNNIEALLLKPLNSVFLERLVCLGVELWLMAEFAKYSEEHLLARQAKKDWFPMAHLILTMIGSYKIATNAVLLK